MTTCSIAEVGRAAIVQLATLAPELGVTKITGRRLGRVRLARVYSGARFLGQFPLLPLGTHYGAVVRDLVQQIAGSRPSEVREK